MNRTYWHAGTVGCSLHIHIAICGKMKNVWNETVGCSLHIILLICGKKKNVWNKTEFVEVLISKMFYLLDKTFIYNSYSM